MANSPLRRILVPLAILLFPVIFWLVLTRGTNHFKSLPVLGPVTVNAQGDSVFHSIAPFSLQNQEGRTITEKDLEGKIVVANFFFATCKTICPKMNEQFKRVQEKYKDAGRLQMLSFTVDPEHDSVAVLADYALKLGADSSLWWFLTGNKDSIYALARESFLVPAAAGKTADDFFHSQDFILVDKNKHIRGIYDGTEPNEVDTLMDEIKLLLYEKDPAVK
ncbi:MAG TPA: SCO family protein [Bacteroidia bacterium]|nr:SCO family protein [Bacteroidia bacterium]